MLNMTEAAIPRQGYILILTPRMIVELVANSVGEGVNDMCYSYHTNALTKT